MELPRIVEAAKKKKKKTREGGMKRLGAGEEPSQRNRETSTNEFTV